jgi:hypothetical protein
MKYGKRIMTDENIEARRQQRIKSQHEYYARNKDKILQKDKLRYQQKKQGITQQQIDNNQSYIQIPQQSEPIEFQCQIKFI